MARVPTEFADFPVPYPDARDEGLLRAHCKHVVDGDTYDFLIDLGMLQYAYETVRLARADTPEIFRPRNDAELAHGHEAKAFAESVLLEKPCLLRTHKGDSFGRFIADVWFPDENGSMVVDPLVLNGPRWESFAAMLDLNGLLKRDSYEEG